MSKITLVLVLMYSILPGCMSRHPTAGHDADFITFNYGEEFSDTDQAYGESEAGEAKVRPAVRVRTSSPSVNALRAYEDNELVQQWIQYFSTSHKETFDTFLRRGSKYRLTIEAILRQHEVPEFLYYLAMIESGFSVTARSHAQAVGVWQFIEGTAKRYDLTVNRYVDERRDPIRATIAAAKYLRDLHNVFQSWFLAMAAYNSGEARVMNAIMKTNTRDFWQLAEQKALPAETRNYIPKIIAAAIIDKNPEDYGFTSYELKRPMQLKLARVPSPVSIKTLSEVFEIPDDKIRYFNPHLLGKITPPNNGHYQIWLPAQTMPPRGALTALTRLSSYAREKSEEAPSASTYRVRKGDSLKSISQKFSIPISTLKAHNNLKGQKIYPNQLLKLANNEAPVVKKYRVRRGDNLHTVAKRFGISVTTLKKINGLKKNQISVGQELHIAPPQI